MKFIELYTGNDNKSHFKEVDAGTETVQPLGNYSKKYPVKGMMFRDFKKGASFNWHTAPQPQYIVYLDGEVEVETSSGERRTFKSGDILFANDTTGKGHITKTLTDGKSLVITTEDENSIPTFRSKL